MSFPRYPAYKDSGIPWVEVIPSSWNVLPLYAIAKECDEPNHGMQESNLLSLSYGRIVQKDINSNDGLLPESFETYQIVQPNDIVLRLTDLQNDQRSLRSALVEQTGIITSAYLAVRPQEVAPRFLSHLLRAYDATKVFYSMGGGLRQSMKFADLKRLPVVLPPMEEQPLIATFLDHETAKIDALVVEQERLIELLKEKRQAVISHAVTKGLDPSVPMKDSGVEWLGEVPAHWTSTKLSRLVAKIGDGLHGTPEYVDDSEFRFINGNNLSGGSISFTDSTRCVSVEEFNKHRVQIDRTTLLLSINGTIGNFALYQGESVMLGKSAAYINCGDQLSREFLCWFLQSSEIKIYFDYSATGTTILNLSLESIRRMPIAAPPVDEQMEVAQRMTEAIGSYDGLLAQTQRAIDLLQERRTALISAAVTGQIDVRGWVPAEAAN